MHFFIYIVLFKFVDIYSSPLYTAQPLCIWFERREVIWFERSRCLACTLDIKKIQTPIKAAFFDVKRNKD